MKRLCFKKSIAGVLALLLLAGTLAACAKGTTTDNISTTVSSSDGTEGTPTDTGARREAVALGISGVKTSETSALGKTEVVFSDDENMWKGLENNPTAHIFAMALEKTAVITKIVIKTPVDDADCGTLRAALLEASVDGKEWVELKAMGNMLSADKVYNITVQNNTAFGYFRIRQPDNNISNAFAIRYIKLYGLPANGPTPDVSQIESGSDQVYQLISMKAVSVYQTNGGDPGKIFTNSGTIWSGSQYLNRCHTVIATMEKKSVISQIRMVIPNPIAGTDKMNGSVIEASTDGESWTTLVTVDSVIQAGATYVYPVEDSTPYSYIRLRQNEERKGSGYDVPNFLVFGTPTGEDSAVYPEKHIPGSFLMVTTLETTNQAGGNKDLVWAENTEQFWLGTKDEETRHYIIGELPENMLITRIVYRNTNQFLSRSRGTQIQVSNDRENWTTVVTLPTSTSDPLYPDKANGYDASGEYREYFLELDQPYRYIRVIQSSALVGYYWTLGNLNVYGVAKETEQP